jgi:uncharacterized protein (DUF302 family)
MKPDGMIVLSSSYDPKETMERLVAAVSERGITVLARIDHAAAAAKVGMELRPTEVLVFGNPKVGTPLMQAEQTIGIDLPLRALVWQDSDSKTWLAYNDPNWLARRHRADRGTDQTLVGMTNGLAAIAREATLPTTEPA